MKLFATAIAAAMAFAGPAVAYQWADKVPVNADGTYFNESWIWTNDLSDLHIGGPNGPTFDVSILTFGREQKEMVIGAVFKVAASRIDAVDLSGDYGWGDEMTLYLLEPDAPEIRAWETTYSPWITDYDPDGFFAYLDFFGAEVLYAYGYYPDEVAGIPGAAGLAAVPEPAAWALMISGFGLVGLAARRRRQVPAS